MKILVSACLLGVPCRYDGQSRLDEGVLALAREHTLIPVCPEQLGGLSTPRAPCELANGRVTDRNGIDRTDAYQKGAEETLRLCRLLGCEKAVLKSRSPSCGAGLIYDGSFSRVLVEGNGLAAKALLDAGIPVESV